MDREAVLGLRARRAKGSEQLLKLATLAGSSSARSASLLLIKLRTALISASFGTAFSGAQSRNCGTTALSRTT